MAETLTDRLGIRRWSSDADTPSRAEFDADHAALELLVAMDMQGTLGARPAAALANRGLYYYATDNGFVYRSTGVAWVGPLNPTQLTVGGATPPAIADAGDEGASAAVARRDHTHAKHAQSVLKNATSLFTARQDLFTVTEKVPARADITGATNVDCSLSEVKHYRLTGNVTLTPTNVPNVADQAFTVTLVFLQDGTGSRTITWWAGITWLNAAGAAPTIASAAGKYTSVTLATFDGGTTWIGFPAATNA